MPAAARKFDIGIPHCSPYVIESGSPDVFINGLPAARMLDPVTEHAGNKCEPHAPLIAIGSTSVMINGLPAAYLGSYVFDCTFIATGSFDVFVGI